MTKRTIGDRLRKLRTEKGETQQDVASAILVDRTIISLYEGNKRKPDTDKLIALANHFDVTTDFLLCQSNVKKSDTTMQAVSEYIGLSDEAILKIKSMKDEPEYIEIIEKLIMSKLFINELETFIHIAKNNKYF